MDVEVQLAQLDGLPSWELQQRWVALVGGPAPRVGPNMLRLALACQRAPTRSA